MQQSVRRKNKAATTNELPLDLKLLYHNTMQQEDKSEDSSSSSSQSSDSSEEDLKVKVLKLKDHLK
jgi:hypothetical protein